MANPFNGAVKEKKKADPNEDYMHPTDLNFELIKVKRMQEDLKDGINLRDICHFDGCGGYKYGVRDYFNFHREEGIPFVKKVM